MGVEEHVQEFVRLLTDHQTAILAHLCSLMPGYPGARDIRQQTNITLWKKKDDFELGTNFKAWAFAVARYQVLSQRRKLRREGWPVFDRDVAETDFEQLEARLRDEPELRQLYYDYARLNHVLTEEFEGRALASASIAPGLHFDQLRVGNGEGGDLALRLIRASVLVADESRQAPR